MIPMANIRIIAMKIIPLESMRMQPQKQVKPSSMNVQSRIQTVYESLRPSEKKVADFLLKHADKVIYLSVSECADRCNVSEATIIRFARLLGLSGYQELKIEMARNLLTPTSDLYEEITPNDSLPEAVTKALRADSQAAADTLSIMDFGRLERAIQAISNAKQILLNGVGTSNLAVQYLGYKLLRLGIPVLSYQDPHLQLISTALLDQNSLVISISHSGATKEVINLIRAAKEKGAATISITNYERSPLAKYSDIMLLTSSKETPFGSGAASSLIAQLVVIDALFVGLALHRRETSFNFLEKTGETVKSQKI